MLHLPSIDPVLIRFFIPYLGEIQIRWYSALYVTALASAYWLVAGAVKRGRLPIPLEQVEFALIATLIGMVVGARLTYAGLYNFPYYSANPIEVLEVWKGGLALHGGLVGGLLGLGLYCRTVRIDTFLISDYLTLILPIGLFLGRLGNFLNGELWGTASEMPWAMIFPGAGPLPRHPSQLYQAIFEGPVLGLGLLLISALRPRPGVITAVFLGAYGVQRFFLEFFREPDAQLGYILGPLSMGQLLSVALIGFAGFIGMHVARREPTL